MRVPADASQAVREAIRDIHAELARLGSSASQNKDYRGARVMNAGDGVADTDYVTVRQHQETADASSAAARASLVSDLMAEVKVAAPPAALTDVPSWLAAILARLS